MSYRKNDPTFGKVNEFDPCLLARDQTVIVEPNGAFATARRRVEVDARQCEECDGQAHEITYENGYRFVRACRGSHLEKRIQRFNRAEIPARYHHASFDEIDRHNTHFAAVVDDLQRYLYTFEPGERGRLFMGEVGVGKTHLMAACLRYLALEKGITCRFVEFSHLLVNLRELYNKNRSETELLGPLVKVPVLAIDELGKGRNSEFEHRIIDELISRRYNEASVSTFFATNFYPRDMGGIVPNAEYISDRIGMRPASRIYEMCEFIPMDGSDYRQILYTRRGRNPR